MKNTNALIVAFLTTTLMSFIPVQKGDYDPDYAYYSKVGGEYDIIYLARGESKNRIKAKYFSAKDSRGSQVSERFKEWSANKSVICYSSGGYMDNADKRFAKPVGINVDNGVIVNRNLADFDGLVIVYATGGVVVSNIKDGDLTLQGGNIPVGKKIDVKSSLDRTMFLDWCESQSATVFQTHLLVYKNELKISSYKSSPNTRERRFLVVGYEDGELLHMIVNMAEYVTLYTGSKKCFDFLKKTKPNMDITYMVNLDTGMQDVMGFYEPNGQLNTQIIGKTAIEDAINLLVYHYE